MNLNLANRYKTINCIVCNCDLYKNPKTRYYSFQNFGVTLCHQCQEWYKSTKQEASFFAAKLYFALRIREIPAELEKFDGFKHIDIAVPKARLNIEVDGVHHNFDNIQAMKDLKRTSYSLLKGYNTIRIPNSLVYRDNDLEETADILTELINHLINKNHH